MRSLAWLPLSLLLLTGCGASSPEMELVEAAAEALGGRAAVEAIDTMVVEGDGDTFWLGESASPDSDPPLFYTTFKRTYDWSNDRFRHEELRSPRFVTNLRETTRVITAVDAEHPFDVDRFDKALRLPEHKSEERRAELLHHPIGAVRAALREGSEISNRRTYQNFNVVDITTPVGAKVSLFLNAQDNLPARVESVAYHPLLGDVTMATTFGSYREQDGLMLPTEITTYLGDQMIAVVRAAKHTLNAPVGRLEAPLLIKNGEPAKPPAPSYTAEELSSGIWYLKGDTDGYHSVLAEFQDHLVLIEAPLDDDHLVALLDKAKELLPEKPVTHLVVTHHHFDHAGGVRAAVSRGLTIVAQELSTGGPGGVAGQARTGYSRGSKAYLEDLVSRKHTRQPDLLASAPKPPTIETFSDKYVMQDETRTMELYPINGSAYADTLLMAYFPAEKLLVEADVYTPPDPLSRRVPEYPFAPNLLENITARNLDVERIVPLHGFVVPFANLEKAATAPPPVDPTTTQG